MDAKDIQSLYESMKVIRKGSEDDFELRASADEKIWVVKTFSEDPKKPTLCLYVGPDAKEMASDLADYETDDDDFEDDDGDDEDDDDEDEDEDDEDDK